MWVQRRSLYTWKPKGGEFPFVHASKGSSDLFLLVLMVLNDLLIELDKAVGTGILAGVQAGLIFRLTVFDLISELLIKASRLHGEILQKYHQILNGMLGFIGRPEVKSTQSKPDLVLLKSVLHHFKTEVGGMANQAMIKAA